MNTNGEGIEFKTRQNTPSSIIPRRGNPGLVPPLGPKAVERTAYIIEKSEAAAAGERPHLGGENKGGKWLATMIEELSEKGYLMQEANAYFTRGAVKKILGYNPTSHYLIQEKKALLEDLKSSVTGLRIAGTGNALLKKGHIERRKDDARITVALPGDLNVVREMLEMIQRKLDGDMLDQPLIIENPAEQGGSGHFWDELLRSLKILDKNPKIGIDPLDARAYVDFDALAHHYGIYITEQREQTLDLIAVLDKKIPIPEQILEDKPVIPDGSVFFVATGTKKKYDEMVEILKAQGINIKIREIFELVDTYVSPKELSRSYEANCAEKVSAALLAWHNMDEKTREGRLKHLGVSKEQAFLIAEDSGFHFMEPGLALEDEFSDIRHTIDVKSPFPGVETGPGTIGSNGIINFMQKIHQIFSRRENPDRRVVTKSILAIAPLKQPRIDGKPFLYMVGAEKIGTFSNTPAPQAGTVEIDNYLIPENTTGLTRNRTEKQLGARYKNHHTARAVAMHALMYELGMKKSSDAKFELDYSKEFVAGVVTDQFNAASGLLVENNKDYDLGEGFIVEGLDPKIVKAIDPQIQIFDKADGFIFEFNPETVKEDLARNLYIFSSAIVGKQTHDKYVLGKPMYIVNPNGEFDDLIRLLYDFHHLGTVPEDPASLIKEVKTREEALACMKKDRLNYRRYHLPSYAVQKKKNQIDGRGSRHALNGSIYMSASSENAHYKEEARKLAKGLVLRKMGIYTGGGAFGPMGEVTQVCYDMRASHGAWHGASSVEHIMSGEGNVEDKVMQFFLARNIYERMEYIAQGNVFYGLPGGTGTIQEMDLLLFLIERANEHDDAYAKKLIKDKLIILVNDQIEHDGKMRGFYDRLIEILPQENFEKWNIHVVKTVDEALRLTDDILGTKIDPDLARKPIVSKRAMDNNQSIYQSYG